eukprot:5193061-Pyramimonas_sp.AAC.1
MKQGRMRSVCYPVGGALSRSRLRARQKRATSDGGSPVSALEYQMRVGPLESKGASTSDGHLDGSGGSGNRELLHALGVQRGFHGTQTINTQAMSMYEWRRGSLEGLKD